MASADSIALFDGAILRRAAGDSFRKLNPAGLIRNPVIFVTEIVAILVTVLAVRELVTGESSWFAFTIAVWLWLTVLFATFAEAVAEACAARAPRPWRGCWRTRRTGPRRTGPSGPSGPPPTSSAATWCWWSQAT